MIYYKHFLSIIVSLILSTLFSFAHSNNSKEIYPNATLLGAQCDVGDAPSLFVLEALFANSENPYPLELWQNRDNEQLNIFDIAREIKSIANLKEKIFNNTDDAKRTRLFERLAQMEDIADRALAMEADKWKPHYVNELMKHIIGIRHAGISDLIPTKVDPSNCKEEKITEHTNQRNFKNLNIINPCDEKGGRWTSQARLSEPNDQGLSIADYMKQQGTDIQLIKNWWNDQLTSSWGHECTTVKIFYSNQRTIDSQSYYWTKDGYQSAKSEYSVFWENGGYTDDELCHFGKTNKEGDYINAFTIWHAYVQEVLAKTKFYHNNVNNKELCVIRTNGVNALKRNNITHFGKGYIIPSAAYDSFSLINIFGNLGSQGVITESLVPHHRVIHLYPLLVPSESINPEDIEDFKKDADFLKSYYDENGLLKIDKRNPFSVEKLIEDYLYHMYKKEQNENNKNIFNNNYHPYDFEGNFHMREHKVATLVSALPEQLPVEKVAEVLLDILINRTGQNVENSSTYFQETEVIVLSGPDLPFDYFYNTNENLSGLEKRLNSGEGTCGYWPDFKDLTQTEELLYQDKKTDKNYIIKKCTSEGHMHEEALADNVYGAMEYAVPESRLYQSPEGSIKVEVYLKNAQPFSKVYHSADETEKKRLRNEISKGFVVDALLANFDVIGFNMDNILVGDDGQIFRANNSGSLRYNAAGELKKEWNRSPMALWTLRDPAINPNSALIFTDINIYEVAEKINKLRDSQHDNFIQYPGLYFKTYKKELKTDTFIYSRILDNTPEVQAQMQARFSNFNKVAVKALEMKAQGISPQEADIKLREWAEAEDWGPAFE